MLFFLLFYTTTEGFIFNNNSSFKKNQIREVTLADLLSDSCLIIISAHKCTASYVFFGDLNMYGNKVNFSAYYIFFYYIEQ